MKINFLSRAKVYYVVFAIGVFCLTTVGATYAYWAASEQSGNVIETASSSYKISMDLTPLYHGFSTIPLDDDNVVKAISNACLDKYSRGACSAYLIDVYDFSEGLNFVSGTITASTNIENLSYVIMAPNIDNSESDKCGEVNVSTTGDEDKRNYCLYTDYTKVTNGVEQVLIDSYDVSNIENVKFILIVWLTNEDRSQNTDGIGTFSANVTISTGSGGKIQGVINDAIEISTT